MVPAFMTEDGISSYAAFEKTSFSFTVFGELLLTKSVTVTSTAAAIDGVVEEVASIVA